MMIRIHKAFWIIGIAALVFYAATFSITVWPGPYALFAAQAIGAMPKNPALSPLALSFYSLFRLLPSGIELGAMCLAAAVIISASAALLFRFCNILYERLIMETDDEGRVDSPTAEARAAQGPGSWVAGTGAAIAAILFVIDASIRLMAGTPNGDGVTILLLLLIVNALIDLHFKGEEPAGLFAFFLLGIGLWESPVFWVAFPGLVAWAIYAQSQNQGVSERTFFSMLVPGIVGAVMGLLFFMIHSGGFSQELDLVQEMLTFYHFNARIFRAAFPPRFWIVTQAVTFLPAAVAFFSLKQFQQKIRYSWASFWFWDVLNLLVAAVLVCNLLRIGPTPWAIFLHTYHVPFVASLLTAFAGGALATFALVQCVTSRIDETCEEYACPGLGRCMVFLPVLATAAVAGLSLYRHWEDGEISNVRCLDRAAKWMVSHAGEAKYILCDEEIYLHLRIQAKLAGKGIACVYASISPQTWRDPWRNIEKPPFQLLANNISAKDTPESVVEAWLRGGPAKTGALLVQSQPELWQRNGYLAIPRGLYYGGQAGTNINTEALLAENSDCWKTLEPLISHSSRNPAAKTAYKYVAQELSSTANGLGLLLRDSNPKDADTAYATALKQNPDNVSAALNRFALRILHPELGEMPEGLLSRLRTYLCDTAFCDSLPEFIHRNGQLAPVFPDCVIPLAMDYLEKPGALFSKWMEFMRPSPRGLPRPIRDTEDAKPISPKLEQALAIYLSGDIRSAKKQLLALLDVDRHDILAWATLGEIYLSESNFAKIKEAVLPTMQYIDNGKPSLQTELLSGLYLSSIYEPDWKTAREHFARAFQMSPDLPETAENLLTADLALGDAKQVKSDLSDILARQPNLAFALTTQASWEISQARLDEAERLLTKCLSNSDSAVAECMLADIWRRRGKLNAAEQHARRSVRFDPGRALSWYTLGVILTELGNKDDGRHSLDYALLLDPMDKRIRSIRQELRTPGEEEDIIK
jgi:tetratricopeptide (TPR) repeat protein